MGAFPHRDYRLPVARTTRARRGKRPVHPADAIAAVNRR